MQSFLAIFTATDAFRARSNWAALSPDEVAQKRAAGVAAWNDWAERNKAVIVDPGYPIAHYGAAGRRKLRGNSRASQARHGFRLQFHLKQVVTA